MLYTFGLSGAPDDGDMPESGLVMDTAGALYGTAVQGGLYSEGVVFKLTPPAAGQSGWTYATLYSFQGGADGALPTGALVLDHAGNLYGTTQGTGSATAISARCSKFLRRPAAAPPGPTPCCICSPASRMAPSPPAR